MLANWQNALTDTAAASSWPKVVWPGIFFYSGWRGDKSVRDTRTWRFCVLWSKQTVRNRVPVRGVTRASYIPVVSKQTSQGETCFNARSIPLL